MASGILSNINLKLSTGRGLSGRVIALASSPVATVIPAVTPCKGELFFLEEIPGW
jgi:hypothetical protein